MPSVLLTFALLSRSAHAAEAASEDGIPPPKAACLDLLIGATISPVTVTA